MVNIYFNRKTDKDIGLAHEIKVDLPQKGYSVFIQNKILKNCGPFIQKVTASKKICVLTSSRIYKICGNDLLASLNKIKVKPRLILIPDGEKGKNEYTLFRVLRKMAFFGLQRDGCLIALGGGVAGDIGGLAASLYMRGIDFIQCPTTLLAQVDASIGGKTAIDFSGIKNLIGSFYQPKSVLIDPEVLKNLDDRQFKTGLAEVIKYGVIKDESMFKDFENRSKLILARNPAILQRLISKSCAIKARIVSEDEREGGKRAWLNYGHTLGHALEAYFGFETLTHGEAISYGMLFAALLSWKLGLSARSVLGRQRDVLQKIGLLRKLPKFRPQAIYEKMLLDKKAREGQIQFILTRKIGLVTIRKSVPRPIVFSALTQLQAEVNQQK